MKHSEVLVRRITPLEIMMLIVLIVSVYCKRHKTCYSLNSRSKLKTCFRFGLLKFIKNKWNRYTKWII